MRTYIIILNMNNTLLYAGGLKSIHYYVIRHTSWFIFTNGIAISTKEECRPKKVLCWKINLIWSHSMRVSWSAYELFSWPLHSIKYSYQIWIIFIQIYLRGPLLVMLHWVCVDLGLMIMKGYFLEGWLMRCIRRISRLFSYGHFYW